MPFSKSRVAFVYAPFGAIDKPALGISLLKSGLGRQGIACDMHYFNIKLAHELGVLLCNLIANNMPTGLLVGEWLFAPSLTGENADADYAYVHEVLWGEYKDAFPPAVVREFLCIRERLPAFLDACVDNVDWSQYDWVGFSSSFEQHCASLALAKRIKSRFPEVRILFGGANCFGAMGDVLCRCFPFIDYVCTGEGDTAVPALVHASLQGTTPPPVPGIIARAGESCALSAGETTRVDDLDTLPYPDYSDYFEQLKLVEKPPGFTTNILMETSRGCWWGEKSPCTFCGLNSTDLTFRYKSSDRVLDELHYFSVNYGRNLSMVDNILAHHYFRTVLPKLAHQHDFSLFWEVKASLNREQVLLLAHAGVTKIQPGIESFSDSILRLMCKGTIAHGHFRFNRFSRYCVTPGAYGITRLTPVRAYRYVYHSLAERDLNDLAYYFEAEYPDDSANYTRSLEAALKDWQSRTDAELDVFPAMHSIRIVDTRIPGKKEEYVFDGLAAEVYLQCDAAQTIRALAGSNHVTENEIITILDQFVTQKLMICSGKQY
ncbi:MAG: RiPP maturation radical SAM C-methyltransferase, partial [Methanomicrobiales archaeon]|nr:RiPP maturation radical SAM C-methyltransferase [Methanomicrobiales archaeon]